MSTNAILSHLRGLLPDVTAALTFANLIPEPIDPVIDAYLRDHLGFWRLRSAAESHVGNKRQHQEDGSFSSLNGRAFAVIDGMGGQSSGYAATKLVIEALETTFPLPNLTQERFEVPQTCPLMSAFIRANAAIMHQSEHHPYLRGQGATAAGVFIDRDHVNVVHIGDCRVYLWRQGHLEALTEDHSLVNEYKKLWDNGDPKIREHAGTWEEIKTNAERYKNVVTRCLGFKDHAEAQWSRHALMAGDELLLCSDGLHDMIPDEKLATLLDTLPPGTAGRCRALMDAVLATEASDNISIILVKIPPPL